jgi:23S rRNA pseudouridine1911/1915/1917 synthase
MRLDQALVQLWPEHSRSRLQQWIEAGHVRVDDQVRRPRDRVLGGEQVVLQLPAVTVRDSIAAQALPLAVVHEDQSLLVIAKPAGLVVHPGAGNADGTLQNALLHHAPELAQVPRAGIVHRLDKDTSGLLVIARTLSAHTYLVNELQARRIHREYEAVVMGRMIAGGSVEAPLGRHPQDRLRMAVRQGGRHALTHYRVLARFAHHTHLRLQLDTGRTHQIRVHMAHIGYPIVGDPLYGGRLRLPAAGSEALKQALRDFKRQALHAARLAFVHPDTQVEVAFTADLPDDMSRLLQLLQGESNPDAS